MSAFLACGKISVVAYTDATGIQRIRCRFKQRECVLAIALLCFMVDLL